MRHLDFIKIARNKNIFIKAIVSNTLKMSDFKKALSLLKKIGDKIPFIIQPQMTNKQIHINTNRLFKLQEYASKFLKNVYIIPQVHKIINAR